MTAEEFLEYYGGTRYVHSSDTRALLNTDLLFDHGNYRRNIFQIAVQHLVHDRAADLVSTQVFRDVLRGKFTSVFEKDCRVLKVLNFPLKWSFDDFTDADIWSGNDQFPGLYRLIHARCLGLLIEETTPLALKPHPDVYVPEKLTNYEIPAPWFFRAAEPLRGESLLHFRVASITIHYYADEKVTPDWIAEALGIQTTEDFHRILSAAASIIEEYLTEEVQTFRGKSESLALLWSRFGERFGRTH